MYRIISADVINFEKERKSRAKSELDIAKENSQNIINKSLKQNEKHIGKLVRAYINMNYHYLIDSIKFIDFKLKTLSKMRDGHKFDVIINWKVDNKSVESHTEVYYLADENDVVAAHGKGFSSLAKAFEDLLEYGDSINPKRLGMDPLPETFAVDLQISIYNVFNLKRDTKNLSYSEKTLEERIEDSEKRNKVYKLKQNSEEYFRGIQEFGDLYKKMAELYSGDPKDEYNLAPRWACKLYNRGYNTLETTGFNARQLEELSYTLDKGIKDISPIFDPSISATKMRKWAVEERKRLIAEEVIPKW